MMQTGILSARVEFYTQNMDRAVKIHTFLNGGGLNPPPQHPHLATPLDSWELGHLHVAIQGINPSSGNGEVE